MNLVDRAKNILIAPDKEWEVIKEETLSIGDMYTKYAMILAAIPAIAGFIGHSLVGTSTFGIHTRTPLVNGLSYAVISYLFSLGGVFLLAYVIDALAPNFGAQKDMVASTKISVFSMTAWWLASIFTILPPLSILSLVGLYSLYLLYVGMKSLKGVSPDKLLGYYIVTLIIAILIYVVIIVAVAAITLTGAMF